MADKIIPSHLKEYVLLVGTRERIVVSLSEMCEANPGYMTKWIALNDIVPLDSVKDENVDMGFDVTSLTGTKLRMVQKTINWLFQFFLNLCDKTYGSSRLITKIRAISTPLQRLYCADERRKYRSGFTVRLVTICWRCEHS